MGRDWAKDASVHAKSPIWLVQYNHPHPYPPGVVITDMDVKTAGAYHNSDLPFWYGTLDSLNMFRHTRDWTPYDYKLSNQMQDVLVAFARTGNPGHGGGENSALRSQARTAPGVRRQRHDGRDVERKADRIHRNPSAQSIKEHYMTSRRNFLLGAAALFATACRSRLCPAPSSAGAAALYGARRPGQGL